MAYQPSHRRMFAVDTKSPMDPTSKNHPKPTPLSSHHHHHPLPDPTIPPPSTIQTISHRFSKLYLNHKRHQTSSKPSSNPCLPPHPQPDTDLQAKILTNTSSCTTLTKSNSQHERKKSGVISLGVAEVIKDHTFVTKVKDGEIKKMKKNPPKKQPFEEYCDDDDVKKVSKSVENERFQQGVVEGMVVVRRTSVSSMPSPLVGVGGGRRRSFCSSQVELGDFLSCNGVKVVAVDMPPFMQIHAVDCARKTHDSLEKFTSKTLAFTLKKEFDGVYGPAWHCIVGTSFGSFVTHSVGGFMYFSLDHKIYILLFKTTVQRAE